MAIEWTLVGTSPALAHVLCRARKVAATNSSVLITGETGTGKELVARALHDGRSPRRVRREGELWRDPARHWSRGSCSGTSRCVHGRAPARRAASISPRAGRSSRRGRRAARGEPGKPIACLQEHEFETVGGSQPVRADVRIIAATNRDLEDAVKRGTFRRDLFYRLDVSHSSFRRCASVAAIVLQLVEHFVALHAEDREVDPRIDPPPSSASMRTRGPATCASSKT